MAGSMVKAYIQSSLSRPLIEIICREHNVSSRLQAMCMPHTQCHCYHVTPAVFKKIKEKQEMDIRKVFNDELLNHPNLHLPKKKSMQFVNIWNGMTVKELAESAQRDVAKVLLALSLVTKGNKYSEDYILTSTFFISNVVKKLGMKPKVLSKKNKEDDIQTKLTEITRQPPPDKSQMERRHPVVTIMGHVDHGKTTLLDSLRNSSVVQSEFGGITQHIGAFNVTLKSGERVTFLDTPGHAAFTAMRQRGANVTDIVVLVIAADDGVMDQTIQSIEMAKSANVPIIVAINKIDKPNVNIQKTQTQLAEHGIISEELGGDVQCVQISALKGINLENLTEAIVLQAELMELKGDPYGLVEGVVIECSNHVGRGKLVTALIQRGTLRKGSLLVSGLASAKVRAMFNDSSRPVFEAKPSEAVQIIGWKSLPQVGDEILEMKDEKTLSNVLKFREKEINDTLAMEHRVAADKKQESFSREYKKLLGVRRLLGKDKVALRGIREKKIEIAELLLENRVDVPTFNLIIKGDVGGSVEALLDIFDTYTYDDICRLNVVHYGVGDVTDSDVKLAETFNAIIYGFNVNTNKKIEEEARQKNVSLRFYNVVYKLFDDIKEEFKRILPVVDMEEVLGEATVLQNFFINEGKKKIPVAGCRCVNGVLLKNEMYRVLRDGETVYTGKLTSMRHLKEEKSSIEVNLECGLRFDCPTVSFQPGDTIVCFKIVRQQQKINWDPGF